MCFEAARPLEPILNSYHILFSVHRSEIFVQLWKSKLREISKSKTTLSLCNIESEIWNPVFTKSCELVDSIKSRNIKLQDVDQYFGRLQRDYAYENLLSLYKALEACMHRPTDTGQWVRAAVDCMQQYWSLCEKVEAAKIVLELKESLKLTGDFRTIENVACEVTSSMKDDPLESIDQRLIDAKSFLEKFTSDRNKLNSLKGFAACMKIVEWMREETKG